VSTQERGPGRLRCQAPAREGMVAEERPGPRRTPARSVADLASLERDLYLHLAG
jgi:hypothetical protein